MKNIPIQAFHACLNQVVAPNAPKAEVLSAVTRLRAMMGEAGLTAFDIWPARLVPLFDAAHARPEIRSPDEPRASPARTLMPKRWHRRHYLALCKYVGPAPTYELGDLTLEQIADRLTIEFKRTVTVNAVRGALYNRLRREQILERIK